MINHVLIVDDSALSRKLVQRCLEFAGLQGRTFIHAGNGREALTMLESRPVDLLVTDLNMPEMDGMELLRAMQDTPELANVKVIVMSSVASDAWSDELKSMGVAAMVSKPMTPDVFAAVLAKFDANQGPA